MEFRSILGLCLSTSLLLAGTTAMADDNKSNNRSARAVQVHIDKDGRKTAPADSDDAATAFAATAATTVTSTELDKLMPAQNSDVQYNADGSMSARLGSANLKFLVLTIDKDGEKTLSHQAAENLGSASKTDSADIEEK